MAILTDRSAAAIKWVEHRIVNPVVAAVLRTPIHWLLSWRFAVIVWEGRQSATRYSTPVIYRQADDDTIVLFSSNEHTNWWKNFRGGHPLDVRYRGEWREARGEIRTEEAAVEDHIRWVLAPLPRASRFLLRRQFPSDEWFEAAADGYVLVDVQME